MSGKVYFIGAGPGDPDLLTRKAWRILQAAEVILHDALVGEEIQVFHAFGRQFLVDRAQDGAFLRWADVPDAAIFNKPDGRVRTGRTKRNSVIFQGIFVRQIIDPGVELKEPPHGPGFGLRSLLDQFLHLGNGGKPLAHGKAKSRAQVTRRVGIDGQHFLPSFGQDTCQSGHNRSFSDTAFTSDCELHKPSNTHRAEDIAHSGKEFVVALRSMRHAVCGSL